jgi:hypothetical protein
MMIFPEEVLTLLRQANAIHDETTSLIIVDNAQIHLHSATDMMGQTVPPLRPYTKASGIAKRKRSVQQKLMDRWTAMDVHVQQPTTRSHHQSRICISSTKLTKESYPLSSPTPSSKDTLHNLIGGTINHGCASSNQKITDSPPSVDLSPRLVRRIPSDDGMNDMEMMIKKAKEQQQADKMESSTFEIMKRCIASPRRPTRQESRKSGYDDDDDDDDDDLDNENATNITSPSYSTTAVVHVVQNDCHSTTTTLSPNTLHHHRDKKLFPYTTSMSKKDTCQHNHGDLSPRKPARRMNTMSHNNLAHLSTIVLSSSPTPVDIGLRAATRNLSNQSKENCKHDNSTNTATNDHHNCNCTNVTTVNTKANNTKSSSSSPSRKTVLSLMEALTIVNLCDVLDNDNHNNNNNNDTLNYCRPNTNVHTTTMKMTHEQQSSSNRSCCSSDESTVESIPSLNSNSSHTNNDGNNHHHNTNTNTTTNTTNTNTTNAFQPVSTKSSIKSKIYPQAA